MPSALKVQSSFINSHKNEHASYTRTSAGAQAIQERDTKLNKIVYDHDSHIVNKMHKFRFRVKTNRSQRAEFLVFACCK